MKEVLNCPRHYPVKFNDNSTTYEFITEGGIKYTAYFICCSCYSDELSIKVKHSFSVHLFMK